MFVSLAYSGKDNSCFPNSYLAGCILSVSRTVCHSARGAEILILGRCSQLCGLSSGQTSAGKYFIILEQHCVLMSDTRVNGCSCKDDKNCCFFLHLFSLMVYSDWNEVATVDSLTEVAWFIGKQKGVIKVLS